jgi:Carboxypeptidase regulatory-like domain
LPRHLTGCTPECRPSRAGAAANFARAFLVSRCKRWKEQDLVKNYSWFQVAAVLFVGFLVALPARAQDESKAQKKAEAQLKVVHGSVIDKSENPMPASVIYLKNVKSQAVKTYIADESGNYRFSGLDPNVDYEIHAEHDDLTSSIRTVSSFDSRRDIEVTLKLSKKKSE